MRGGWVGGWVGGLSDLNFLCTLVLEKFEAFMGALLGGLVHHLYLYLIGLGERPVQVAHAALRG